MATVAQTYKLTHEGAMKALQTCVDYATKINVPVTISICDASGVLLAACRMDGSYFLTLDSSLNKAVTAAATFKVTGWQEDIKSLRLGVATFGRQTNAMMGGVPIIVNGHPIGGIGVGSGTGEQDREIALAGLKAIEGAKTDFELSS